MKSKLIIFLLLLSVAGFSQIRHDQLRKPIVESTDTVLMFKNTAMGFEYTRTVLDTTIIKGLDLFVKERVSDSTNYLLGRLNDTVAYILGQIPTTLVELDSSGFRIKESQILDLKNYLTVESDPIYSAWDKSTGISITESQISDLKSYLLSESDPIYSQDSAKIVWFKDLKFTQDSLKTINDTIVQHNLRLLEIENWDKDYFDLTNRPNFQDSISTYQTDNQQLSIDSLNRVFTLNLSNGGSVKFKDENTTYDLSPYQQKSDTLTFDATKYDLEQLKLTDLDSTGFSVDTTQVRDLLEFVQNNGGGGSGDGYWEETIGGDTIQNNNVAPVKIQTSLLFGDEEVVTGSTGMYVYVAIDGSTSQPLYKSTDGGLNYVALSKTQTVATEIVSSNNGQYVVFRDNSYAYISNDYGNTWSQKSMSNGARVSMTGSGQKMVSAYWNLGIYNLSTNYGQSFTSVTVNGITGYIGRAHISSDGGSYYLNGSESSKYVYYSSDGVNFTSFGGQLSSGGIPSFLSQDGSVFIVKDYVSLKKSVNRGSWVDITPSGYNGIPVEVDMSEDGTIIGFTQTTAGAYISRNGGTSWIQVITGSVVFKSISMTSDGSIIFFGGTNGNIYKYEWNGVTYGLISTTPIGTGSVWVTTNKGTSSISVHPFEVRENSNYLEASVNNQTAFKINQDGQFGLRTGGFASKINTTVTGDFSALITDKAVKDYIDRSGSTMVYPAAGIPVSLGTSWRSTSISPSVGYLYYNGANYSWNSGSSDGNNYPTTLVYTTADRQLTLGRNGLGSISTFFPLASATDAGLIKVGSGLSIDGNGVLSSNGGSMVYPSGSGIPIVNSSSSWGTTISPSNGYLNYNNGSWSFSTPSGGGDMFKATYDTNSNNIVDNSEALGGTAANQFATLSGSQALTNKSVNGVTLSSTGNGLSYLSNDGTYKTVTSGGMVYPSAGIAVSTGSAWGASITNNSTNWNTAYNDRITSLAFSGTTTKTLTLTQSDGGTVTGTFTDLGGGDMLKATYDTNSNNIVDNSEALGGVVASSYVTLSGSQSLTNKSVNGVTLSTSQGTSNFLRGDGTYAAPPSGVGTSSNGQILFNRSNVITGNNNFKMSDNYTPVIGGSESGINKEFENLFTGISMTDARTNAIYGFRWNGLRNVTITAPESEQSFYLINNFTSPYPTNYIASGYLSVLYYNSSDNKTVFQKIWVKVQNHAGVFSNTYTEVDRKGDTGVEYDLYGCYLAAANGGFYIRFKTMNSDSNTILVNINYDLNILKY